MADQTFDPRLESLLRDALAKEAASLQLTVRADQVVERAQGRRNGRPGWRRLLPDQPNAGLLRLSAAVGTVMVLVVTGVLRSEERREGKSVELGGRSVIV